LLFLAGGKAWGVRISVTLRKVRFCLDRLKKGGKARKGGRGKRIRVLEKGVRNKRGGRCGRVEGLEGEGREKTSKGRCLRKCEKCNLCNWEGGDVKEYYSYSTPKI